MSMSLNTTDMELLRDLAEKYGYADLSWQAERLENEKRQLNIGVLGEFNAGKSTLVNALLGRKVLPALDRPTTAAIVEVQPDPLAIRLAYYRRANDGELASLSVDEFDDLVLNGGSSAIAVLKVQPSELLPDGYRIIDTPGLASLEETHTDITLGYLPGLDGALVCQDINKGGLTASLQTFLARTDVRPFLSKLVFVLTRADTKAPSSVEALRLAFVAQLEDFYQSQQTPIDNLDTRVIAVSPLGMLAGNADSDLQAFGRVFDSVFRGNRQTMLVERTRIERASIAESLVSRLRSHAELLTLDRSEYAARRKALHESVVNLRQDESRVLSVLAEAESAVQQVVRKAWQECAVRLEQGDAASHEQALEDTAQQIDQEVRTVLDELFNWEKGFSSQIDIDAFKRAIKPNSGIKKIVDYLPLILSALAKIPKIGPVINNLAPFAPFVTEFLLNLLDKISLSPQQIDQFSDKVSKQLLGNLRERLEHEVFAPLQGNLSAALSDLDSLDAEERTAQGDLETRKAQVQADLATLGV